MIRILDIALKDLVQILRDKKVFLFMLIMPVAFTFLFGFAFGGFRKGEPDPRLKVAILNEDNGDLSPRLVELLGQSEVISIVQGTGQMIADYEKMLEKGKIAAILVIPQDYSSTLVTGGLPRLLLTTNMSQASGTSIQTEILTNAYRLASAVQTALILAEGNSSFNLAFTSAMDEWKTPPVIPLPGGNQVGDSAAYASTPPAREPAHAAPQHGDPYARVFLVLALLLVCAMAGHFVARKLNQSAVLGELAVGILVGALFYQLSAPTVTINRLNASWRLMEEGPTPPLQRPDG